MWENNCLVLQHNQTWPFLFEPPIVLSSDSQLVSFCPCVWEFYMLSGPQILDVLSCTAGLIAAHWPHTLRLPKATPRPHQVKCWAKIWLKLEWRDTRACEMASGMKCSRRQNGIRNIRYACIAAGYSTGLETSIISQQLEYETRPCRV